jgi:BlaI family penicillinase repressor
MLVSQQQWQQPTVNTLLNRLLKKGAITARKDGRRYLYTAVLRRDQWRTSERTHLLDRLRSERRVAAAVVTGSA